MEKKSFSEFVKEILALGYDWRVWLHYPAPAEIDYDPNLVKFWRDGWFTPEGDAALKQWNEEKARCVRNWIAEIMFDAGEQGFRYIKVTEDRLDYSSRYNILIGGCSKSKLAERDWLSRWYEMSGGYGYERPINDRLAGLLTNLVMHKGHRIEVWRTDPKEYYTREDFF